MKKATILLCLILGLNLGIKAQKVQTDSSGNYIAVRGLKMANNSYPDRNKQTGKTITTTDGRKYEVWESINGKLFYYRTSKNGNVYKSYIQQ